MRRLTHHVTSPRASHVRATEARRPTTRNFDTRGFRGLSNNGLTALCLVVAAYKREYRVPHESYVGYTSIGTAPPLWSRNLAPVEWTPLELEKLSWVSTKWETTATEIFSLLSRSRENLSRKERERIRGIKIYWRKRKIHYFRWMELELEWIVSVGLMIA